MTKPATTRAAPLWTEAERAELQRLHDEGLAPPEIARRMGKTPNAIVGQLYRERRRRGDELISDRYTAEQDDILRRMWTEGATVEAIAAAIGKSRASVAIRRRLLRLPVRNGPAPRGTRQTAAQAGGLVTSIRNAAERSKRPPVAPLPPTVSVSDPVSLADLGPRRCRWIGDRPVLLTLDTPIYCGAPTDGGPWCPEHRARVFVQRGVAA